MSIKRVIKSVDYTQLETQETE